MGPYSEHVPVIFLFPFNEPKQLPKAKCAYIEDHARMLPAPGVICSRKETMNLNFVENLVGLRVYLMSACLP